jgi:nucleoside-diphosphate-sugar epimerase
VKEPVPIRYLEASVDDPKQRKPDISRAKACLGWEPIVPVLEGVQKTIEYFRQYR